MTVLRLEDRKTLMRGMALRRLRRTLTEEQLGVGIGEDFNAICKQFRTFDFEAYIGVDFETFIGEMIQDDLVVKTVKPPGQEGQDEVTEYGPGPKVSDFDAALSEDMEWFIDDLPMSTRGLFDNMLNTPTRKETLNINDVIDAHNAGENRIVEDTRNQNNTRKKHVNDHGLRAGPTGKK